MELAIVVDVFVAVVAYVAADKLIGSRNVKDGFVKANLCGKDMNKTSEDRV